MEKRTHTAIVKSAKITHLCASAVIFLYGILLITMPPEIAFVQMRFLMGIGAAIIGLTGIYGYFSNDVYRLAFQSDLALGTFNTILGSLLIFSPDKIQDLLPYAAGFFVILCGGNCLQIAVEGKFFGMNQWFWILVSALVEVGVGITAILCATGGNHTQLWMGIALSVAGVVNFWTTMYTVRVRSRADGTDSKNTQ